MKANYNIRPFVFGVMLVSIVLFLPNASADDAKERIVKITSPSGQNLRGLLDMGLEVIVIEETYFAARVTPEQETQIKQAGFHISPIKEKELIQRLIKVPILGKNDSMLLSEVGLDIWEVREDHVIGQAFDKDIKSIKDLGYSVEILDRDSRESLKKKK